MPDVIFSDRVAAHMRDVFVAREAFVVLNTMLVAMVADPAYIPPRYDAEHDDRDELFECLSIMRDRRLKSLGYALEDFERTVRGAMSTVDRERDEVKPGGLSHHYRELFGPLNYAATNAPVTVVCDNTARVSKGGV